MNKQQIEDNLQSILKRIDQAKNLCYRPKEVTLLAVSKKKSAGVIRIAWDLGLRNFGESYLQEAAYKIDQLTDLPEINWHFIGAIQSNKTKDIAKYFSWVHSVSNLKIAQRLNDQLPADKPALNICIQVNIDEEQSKSGISIQQLDNLIEKIIILPKLKLRGLMALPKINDQSKDKRKSFKILADLLQKINCKYKLSLDTLSMGMSNDFEEAILEGASIVRIGSVLFGNRI